MDLSRLSDDQLRAEYLKANRKYVEQIRKIPNVSPHLWNDDIKEAKQYLNAILDEVKRRQEEERN